MLSCPSIPHWPAQSSLATMSTISREDHEDTPWICENKTLWLGVWSPGEPKLKHNIASWIKKHRAIPFYVSMWTYLPLNNLLFVSSLYIILNSADLNNQVYTLNFYTVRITVLFELITEILTSSSPRWTHIALSAHITPGKNPETSPTLFIFFTIAQRLSLISKWLSIVFPSVPHSSFPPISSDPQLFSAASWWSGFCF